MYKTIYIVFFFIMCGSASSVAQDIPPLERARTIDSLPGKIALPDPLSEFLQDSLPADSIPFDFSNVKIVEGGFDSDVDFGGDSTWYDAISKKYHLYGKAFVNYQDMKLTAGYIIFELDTDIAEAYYREDEKGEKVEPPTFIKGQNQFTYKELRFNFKTRKGIVLDAISQEGEFFLRGSKTKFISRVTDSLEVEDELYNSHAVITTCDHDIPHYGIRTRKLKVIPNKLAVIGFSQLEIANVPLPIFLPFGFFPLIKGESAGLIFPDDYEFNRDLGLGFREIGYYFPINDYVDLRLTGDIYTRGTYRIRANANYAKRYSFNGRINLGFANNRIEDQFTGEGLRNQSINISITHNQDAKAHPYRNIGGTVNIQTNNYQQRNFNDVNSQLNNRLNSNFYFRHSMPGTPFSFNAGMSHDQNNQTREVNVTLPDIRLNMNTIFPLKRKNAAGTEKWYEKFALNYDMSMKNLVRATDTTLFTSETLRNMQTGVSHRAGTNASFNVLKYFTVTPSANYEELWFFSTNRLEFDPTPIVTTRDSIIDPDGNLIITRDTMYGQQIQRIQRGFQPVRQYDAGINMTTQIFGTKTFSKGFIRGLRHVIKPNVGLQFAPDSRERYLEIVDTDSREEFNMPREYNPYLGGAVGSPQLRERQMAMTFSIQNVFEGKYFSKKDSTEKKFKLWNTLTLNGGYNFAADSLKWRDLTFTGNTTLFGLTTVAMNGSFTPYVYENNRITSKTLWSERGTLLELRNIEFRFNTTVRFTEVRDLLKGKKGDENGAASAAQQRRQQGRGLSQDREGGELESILDLFSSFTINHQIVFRYDRNAILGRNFNVPIHSMSISGNLPLTRKWDLTLGNISYDISRKSFVYPTLGVSRDLHCWNLNFQWYPSNGVYTFFIGVKSSALNFIRYNYGQQNAAVPFR